MIKFVALYSKDDENVVYALGPVWEMIKTYDFVPEDDTLYFRNGKELVAPEVDGVLLIYRV